MKKTMTIERALAVLAADLETQPEWLDRLIRFESNWRPDARNPISGARGLIQFIHSTARSLGYADANDLVAKNPTSVEQLLGPVRDYLERYAPFPTEQSLYMSVFYPAARRWPPEREFPAVVQEYNPGIRTVADYVAKVKRRAATHIITSTVALAAVIGTLGVVLFFIK